MTVPDLTAEGSGYYRTYVDGVEQSRHVTERKAIQKVYELRAAHPEAAVHYDHDYRVVVGGQAAEPEPEPTPEPEPEPVPPAGEPDGAVKVWALDPSQPDQTAANPDQPPAFVGSRWTAPEVDPDYGAFFGLADGAMEFRWKDGAGDGRCAMYSIRGFHTGPVDPMYVRMRLRFSENWQPHGSGTTKLLNFESAEGGNFTFNVNDQDAEGGGLALHNIPADEAIIWETVDTTLIQPGVEYLLEVVAYRESAPGADDGRLLVYLDGVEVTGWNRLPGEGDNPRTRIDAMTWHAGSAPAWDAQKIGPYWGGSGSVKDLGAGAHDAIRFRELYVSGVPVGATEEPVEEEPAPEPDPAPEPVEGAAFADDFDGGALSADQNGYGWGLVPGGEEGVNLTVEPGVGLGGGAGLVLTHPPKPSAEDSVAQANFHLGRRLTEAWIDYHMLVPANYRHRVPVDGPYNNKFSQLWGGPRHDQYVSTIWELVVHQDPSGLDEDVSRLDLAITNRTAGDPSRIERIVDPFISPEDYGRWVRLRWHYRLASGPDAWDGLVEVWRDDELVVAPPYLTRGGDELPGLNLWGGSAENTYYEQGRLLGWSNSGYDEETRFVFDAFRVYESDPGW